MKLKNKIYLLVIIIFTLGLTACSNQTKTKTSSSTTKEEASELTKKEQGILKNGYKLENYTFYLSEAQKEEQSIRDEVLSKINEIKQRYENQKDQIKPNKKINIFVHGMAYDGKTEKYNLSCFLLNTSGDDINSFKLKLRPKFKNVQYDEWIDFKGDKKRLGNFSKNSIFTFDISGYIPKESYPELSQNTAKDIQIEIKDLEINGKKVDNEK